MSESSINTLTLLYTANIFGRLDLAPRLATLIQREKAKAEGPLFILDGGNTCSPALWPCAVTGFSAGHVMLEAMAYDASAIAEIDMRFFHSMGAAGEAALVKMAGQGSIVALNASYSWIEGVQARTVVRRKGFALGIVADWQPSQDILERVGVDSLVASAEGGALSSAAEALHDEADVTVFLASSEPDDCVADICMWPIEGQGLEDPLALAVSRYSVEEGSVRLLERELILVSDDVPSEPTISAVLELVVEEAARLRGPQSQ